jgi:HAAS domain-containing protein
MDTQSNHPTVEGFLDRVRASLRGMPAAEIEEIVLELRGHIAERSEGEGGPEAALHSLGDPETLARQYRTDRVTAQGECSSSPITLLHSLLLLRRESPAGWSVVVLAAFVYAWALALGAAAIEKILSPRDVGLWHCPGTMSLPRIMIDGPGPAGTREMLGWWFVPLAALASAGLFLFMRTFAQWWIRRSRAAHDTHST